MKNTHSLWDAPVLHVEWIHYVNEEQRESPTVFYSISQDIFGPFFTIQSCFCFPILHIIDKNLWKFDSRLLLMGDSRNVTHLLWVAPVLEWNNPFTLGCPCIRMD